MAKQRTFFEKIIQKLKRDAGLSWTRNVLDDLLFMGYDREPDMGELDLIGEGFVGSLQQEAYITQLYYRVYGSWGHDDPLFYPGLMAAWDTAPVTVDFSKDVIDVAQEQSHLAKQRHEAGHDRRDGRPVEDAVTASRAEASLALSCISAEAVRSLFPSCLMCDIRDFGLTMYKTKVDAIFIYPSYDADRDYGMLLAVAVNLQKGLKLTYESKLVLKGDNLYEMRTESIAERERLRGRCLAGIDSGLHEEVFTPYDDEETILYLTTIILWLILHEGGRVDLSLRRGVPHLHVRMKPDEDEPDVPLDLSFVGKSIAQSDKEMGEHFETYLREVKEKRKAAEEAKVAEEATKAEARRKAEERAKERAEARKIKAENRARAKEAARKAIEERARKKAEAAKAAKETQVEKVDSQALIKRDETERQSEAGTLELAREIVNAEAPEKGAVIWAHAETPFETPAETPAEASVEASADASAEALVEAPIETTATAHVETPATIPETMPGTARQEAECEPSDGQTEPANARLVAFEEPSPAIPDEAPPSALEARLRTELEKRLENISNEDDLLDAFGEALLEIDELKEQLAIQESKAATLDFHLKQARSTLEEAQRHASGARTRSSLVETMNIPDTPADALTLAEEAFPDRLVVLPEAHRSAADFRKGSAAEVWAVLRSMATVLHRLVFGPGGGSITHIFEDETGFEVTLREMKHIKSSNTFSQLRTVSYKGVSHDTSAHVKGKGSKKGETLRVHFFADYDERKIVIAHCGEHLATFDTSSL